MHTLNDLNAHAKQISNQYLANKSASINKLTTKLAQDKGYNPEEIRTVVRLANVLTYEDIFDKKASAKDTDRDIEFSVGDPETVIKNLRLNATEKTASILGKQTPTHKTQDLYGNITTPANLYKEAHYSGASVLTPKKKLNKQEIKYFGKQAEQRVHNDRLQHAAAWDMLTEKIAQTALVDFSNEKEYSRMEKAAMIETEGDCLPELLDLRIAQSNKLGFTGTSTLEESLEKTAATLIGVTSTKEKRILSMLKEASQHRKKVLENLRIEEWLKLKNV